MDEHIDRELHDIEKHKQRERARARKCANHGVSVKELHDAAVSPLLGPVKRTEALVVEGAGIGTALYLRYTVKERERECACVRESEEDDYKRDDEREEGMVTGRR